MQWSLKANEKAGPNSTMTKREYVAKLEADGHDASWILDEEPELYSTSYPYWEAFHLLTSSRNTGFGVGAIPLPAYESYFRIFGVDSLEEQLDYLKFVGVLDSEYLKWQGEKSEKDRSRNQSKPKSKGRRSK